LFAYSLSDPICTLDGDDDDDGRKQQKEENLMKGISKIKRRVLYRFTFFKRNKQ
jgi:hypothetical protein